MVGRCSFWFIPHIWDRPIQSSFVASLLLMPPPPRPARPALTPSSGLDPFRSLQYDGKMLILVHPSFLG